MKNLSEKVIEEIRTKNIKPRSRQFFFYRQIFIWVIVFLFLVLASFWLAVILDLASLNDFDMALRAGNSWWKFLFFTLPYFWLVLWLASVLVLFIFFRHTKKGYLWSWRSWLPISLAGCFLLASLFSLTNIEKKLISKISQNKFSRPLTCAYHFWHNPEKGLLLGKISEFTEKGFVVIDSQGESWNLEWEGSRAEFKIFMDIKAQGRLVSPQRFLVEEIRPAEARCSCPHNCTCQAKGGHCQAQ